MISTVVAAWDDGGATALVGEQLTAVSFEPEEVELMLWSGFSDRYDKPIYEGDIVRYRNKKYKVVYSAGCFALEDIENSITSIPMCQIPERSDFSLTIMGNLKQHPNLLKY